MARVALVTGGVSGIGAATATLLKGAGYTVVTNYFGNVEEAAALAAASSIPVREWNVADYEASRAGVAVVEQEFGPVEILINNAGITRDSTLHKMTPDQWRQVIDVDLAAASTCAGR